MIVSSNCIYDDQISSIVTPFIECLNCYSLKITDLTFIPLKGGGSSASLYRFDIFNRSFVIRLFPSQASLMARNHQVLIAKEAGKLNFGPKIHFVDPEKNGMKGLIMDFIPGRTTLETDFKDETRIIEFAKFLSRLHNSSVDFPIAVSPFNRFADFCSKMKSKESFLPDRFSEVKALMEELETIFNGFNFKVPSHLDLHPLNIMLFEDHFSLVDWVNGGMSDPYFDLATFATFLGLKDKKLLLFLRHYFGREPTELEWNRFFITQPIRLFVIAASLFLATNDIFQSYEEITRSISLPLLSDFGRTGAIWPPSILGASMFHSALSLVDQNEFKESLQYFKKHP